MIPIVILSFVLLALYVNAQSNSTVDPNALLTGPEVCVRQSDCPRYQFCSENYVRGEHPRYRCIPRAAESQRCFPKILDRSSCKNGLYCKRRSATCQKQITSTTRPCNPLDSSPCAGDKICDRNTKRCRMLKEGKLHDACDMDDDCTGNLVCFGYHRLSCVKPLSIGEHCGLFHDEPPCAPGTVCSRTSQNILYGRCTPYLPYGAPCLPTRYIYSRCQPPYKCIGRRCLGERRIIRELGAPCFKERDLCDRDRGLFCLWNRPLKRFACQQKGKYASSRFLASLCTPGSPFSSCRISRTGSPETCRKSLSSGLFVCTRHLITLKLGESCNNRGFNHNILCTKGAECITATGVEIKKYRGKRVKTCAKLMGEGANCSNRFKFTCRTGLKCSANGVCVKGNPSSQTNVTHLGLGVECANRKLPCVPGTFCLPMNSRFAKCSLPTIVKQENEPCYSTPNVRTVCGDGLVCSRAQGNRIWICKKPVTVGGECEYDDVCAEGLKCGLRELVAPFLRRCFNPDLELPLGAACNVNAKFNESRCVRTSFTLKAGLLTSYPTMCLPESENGTRHVCSVPMKVMESCTPGGNFRCIGEGIKCSTHGVCRPSSG